MKKDYESSYRCYRIVSTKKIDGWFYQKDDPRRCHAKIYESVILPIFGICENTFLDYRNEPNELLDIFPQAAYIEFSLWLPTMQAQYMTPTEANRFSLWLWHTLDRALRNILKQEPGCRIDAETLIAQLLCLLKDEAGAEAK